MLLQKEFPTLKSFELPSYKISYSKKGNNLILKLFLKIPSIFFAIQKEKKLVKKIIENEQISGIISDNRLGVFHKKIPSVYITHQLNVLSGFTTFLTSKVHQKIIKQFTECWIPDFKEEPNFSGKLGHLEFTDLHLKYIGILSRFKFKKLPKKYDIIVILSGPEPQRTLLEKTLFNELKNIEKKVLVVRGVFNSETVFNQNPSIEVVNYLTSKLLEEAINQSDLVIARSGYTTIMDLAVLGKKVFFIPTPGQKEQEYLAKFLADKKNIPFVKQNNFKIEILNQEIDFKGFEKIDSKLDSSIFSLFEGE